MTLLCPTPTLSFAAVHALKLCNCKDLFLFTTFNFRSLSLITDPSISVATGRCFFGEIDGSQRHAAFAKIKRRRVTKKKRLHSFRKLFDHVREFLFSGEIRRNKPRSNDSVLRLSNKRTC